MNWHTVGRGHRPSAVRKVEARPPAPDLVSKVATDFGTKVKGDPEGLKRRGGSDRHGQLKVSGTGLGMSGAGRPMPSLQDSPTDTQVVRQDLRAIEVFFTTCPFIQVAEPA